MIEKLKPYLAYKDSGVPVPRVRQAGAWYDPESVKIGYKINFNRYFYKPKALRTLEETCAGLLAVEKEQKGCWRRFWEEYTMNKGLKFARFLLVLSSTSPLFILWAVQGNSLIPDNLFTGLCTMMIIVLSRPGQKFLKSPVEKFRFWPDMFHIPGVRPIEPASPPWLVAG